jgi:hypothetical protein
MPFRLLIPSNSLCGSQFWMTLDILNLDSKEHGPKVTATQYIHGTPGLTFALRKRIRKSAGPTQHSTDRRTIDAPTSPTAVGGLETSVPKAADLSFFVKAREENVRTNITSDHGPSLVRAGLVIFPMSTTPPSTAALDAGVDLATSYGGLALGCILCTVFWAFLVVQTCARLLPGSR